MGRTQLIATTPATPVAAVSTSTSTKSDNGDMPVRRMNTAATTPPPGGMPTPSMNP
jgi:hypothetical protein